MRYLLAAVILIALSFPAFAAQHVKCDKRAKVLQFLSQKYQESTVAMGVTSKGGLVEVLSADNNGSWSIIVTTSSGVSCLVAFGEGWQVIARQETGKES